MEKLQFFVFRHELVEQSDSRLVVIHHDNFFFFLNYSKIIYIYISSLIKRNLGRRCSSSSYLRYEMRAHHVTSGNSWLLSLCALTG